MSRLRTRSQALCTACGELFSSVSAFDRHQTGVEPVVCHDPASKGLIPADRGWHFPGGRPNIDWPTKTAEISAPAAAEGTAA